MSTIEKLSIQGIRSFGPNADDMQSLSFVPPLTLIVGENGCGKTTIIECLKYALTGEAPPGSDRGKSFIHDPKIFSRVDALGQVKLQVSNIRGERVSVCRSMKISMRGGKYTFETLDSTMNNLSDGNSVGGRDKKSAESISKRCADVDAAMCQFMGVSKAIINNVLFCHQEDSSWPLDEAKKLKEKFDAIFGITEYNKAIEDIIKLRKSQMEELKDNERNLSILLHLKQEMENKAMSLESAQQKHNRIEEQCQKCELDMQPINKRLSEIHDIEFDNGKYQARLAGMQTRLNNCNDQVQNLRKKIKSLFAGSLSDIEQELADFDTKMRRKIVQKKEKQEELAALGVCEKDLQKSLNELDKKCYELGQQAASERESSECRAEKIQTLCCLLKKPLSAPLTSDVVPQVLEEITASLQSEQQRITDETAQNDAEDQRRQQDIDNLRVELTRLEQQITTLKQQQERQQKECTDTQAKIREVERSTARLKELNNNITVLSDAYETLQEKYKKEDLRALIDTRKKKVSALQQQFHDLDERVTRMSAVSKQLVEISLKEQELQKREQEQRRLKGKHSDDLRKLLPRPVESNYRRAVQQVHEQLQREIETLNRQLNKSKQQEQSLEIARKNLKDDVQRLEVEQQEAEEKIFASCRSSKPYEELVNESKMLVDKCQLDLGALRSAEAMYKKCV